jgi:hypothetical protein
MFRNVLRVVLVVLVATLALACNKAKLDQEAREKAEQGTILDGSIAKKDLKKKPQWKPVFKVKDKKSQKTKVFKISGGEWKIRWRTVPGKKGDDEFIIMLNDRNNQDVAEIIANVTGADEDFAYLEGKGEYYLQVTTTQPYEIIIEEAR